MADDDHVERHRNCVVCGESVRNRSWIGFNRWIACLPNGNHRIAQVGTDKSYRWGNTMSGITHLCVHVECLHHWAVGQDILIDRRLRADDDRQGPSDQ